MLCTWVIGKKGYSAFNNYKNSHIIPLEESISFTHWTQMFYQLQSYTKQKEKRILKRKRKEKD